MCNQRPGAPCRAFFVFREAVATKAIISQFKRDARLADDALESHCANEAMSKLLIPVVALTPIVVSAAPFARQTSTLIHCLVVH